MATTLMPDADLKRMAQASDIALRVIEQTSTVIEGERHAAFEYDLCKLMLKLSMSNMKVARTLYEASVDGERKRP